MESDEEGTEILICRDDIHLWWYLSFCISAGAFLLWRLLCGGPVVSGCIVVTVVAHNNIFLDRNNSDDNQ